MAAFGALGGVQIVHGTIAIPLYGMWTADVYLATDQALATQVALTIGNLTMQGAVVRQATFAGARSVRAVGGFGGWRRTVPAKHYSLNSGVKLSLVMRDAALESGERVNVPADRIVGQAYVRENAPASRVLRQLAGQNWYIDAAGVTQIAAWPTTAIPPASFTLMNQDGGRGKVEINTEDYAAWMPGKTFTAPTVTGTLRVGGALYRFAEKGTFTLEVLTS